MVNKTKSVLVSDVKIKGNITEKESIIIDGEVNGNINAKLVETFENSNVKGNITSKGKFPPHWAHHNTKWDQNEIPKGHLREIQKDQNGIQIETLNGTQT